MSAAAVAVTLLILSAGVVWGVVVDHLHHLDERANRDADRDDHDRALMREIRRHTDDGDVRWRP
jgi:hypothetical protein